MPEPILLPVPLPTDDLDLDFVRSFTANYTNADEQAVTLRVGNYAFRVSRNRLMMRSPQFTDMFKLPQMSKDEAIVLYNDPDEFKCYLWYIHADPFAATKFFSAHNTAEKCMTLLGIASIAHMYEAVDVAQWAMNWVLDLLVNPSRYGVLLDAPLATRLLRTAARWRATDQDIHTCARNLVCDAMHGNDAGPLAVDPVKALLVSKEVDDTFVAGHAYFYIMLKGSAVWGADVRLCAQDRRNLMSGFMATREKQWLTDCTRSHNNTPRMLAPLGFQEFVCGDPVGSFGTRTHSPVHFRIPSLPGMLIPGSGDIMEWRTWSPLIHGDIANRNELETMFDGDKWNMAG